MRACAWYTSIRVVVSTGNFSFKTLCCLVRCKGRNANGHSVCARCIAIPKSLLLVLIPTCAVASAHIQISFVAPFALLRWINL